MTIYTLADSADHVRYVGMTRDPKRREKQYRGGHGHTKHLRNWLRANPDFHFISIEVVPDDEGDARERYWIACYREQGAALINYTTGGEGNFAQSPETREHLRRVQREYVQRGQHVFVDPVMRERQRAAVSRKFKGVLRPGTRPDVAAWNKARIGIPLTPEHTENMRKAVTGRRHTPEARERMKAATKIRMADPVIRAKISAANRASPLVAASRQKAIAASAEKRRGVPLTAAHRALVSEKMKGRRNPGLVAYWAARKSDGEGGTRTTITESQK